MKVNQFEDKFKNVLNFIKLQRKLKGINQIDISNKLNTSRSNYNQIELGNTKMTAFQLLEISSLLELSMLDIESIYSNTNKKTQRTIPETVQPDYIENLQKLCSQQQSIIDTQQKLITSLELKLKL